MYVIVTYVACGICLQDACLVRQEELGIRVRHLSAGGDRIMRREYDIRIRVGSPNVGDHGEGSVTVSSEGSGYVAQWARPTANRAVSILNEL